MATWEPKKLNPTHYRILLLHWHGLSHGEIAAELGVAAQTVSSLVCSEAGEAILSELAKRSLDTVADVQLVAQALAPAVMEEKARLALGAKDERVRNIACTDILNMAGHQPVRRVLVEKADSIDEAYRDKSVEELRQVVLEKLGIVATPPTDASSSTVH